MRQDYRLIHLQKPYHTLANEQGQKYYAKILDSRLRSYRMRYGERVLPFGSEDILCDYVAVERRQDQVIVGSFKYISLATCQAFSVTFPLLHTLQHPVNDAAIAERVSTHLTEAEHKAIGIGYIGSLTVNKDQLPDTDHRQWVKQLLSIGIIHIVNDERINEVIVTGTIPNHSHEFIQWLGFDIFVSKPVVVWDIGKTTAYVLRWHGQWSSAATQLSLFLQRYWDSRLQIIAPERAAAKTDRGEAA